MWELPLSASSCVKLLWLSRVHRQDDFSLFIGNIYVCWSTIEYVLTLQTLQICIINYIILLYYYYLMTIQVYFQFGVITNHSRKLKNGVWAKCVFFWINQPLTGDYKLHLEFYKIMEFFSYRGSILTWFCCLVLSK